MCQSKDCCRPHCTNANGVVSLSDLRTELHSTEQFMPASEAAVAEASKQAKLLAVKHIPIYHKGHTLISLGIDWLFVPWINKCCSINK